MHAGPLIDVDTLARALGVDDASAVDPPPVVLDVRWRLAGAPPAELYRQGHLPGGTAVDLDRDLAGPPGQGGRHPLPDPAVLEATLRRWGIGTGSVIVAYDEADGSSAARAWWTLRWAGLDDVRVLDGGLAAWRAAGYPLTTVVPTPTPGDVRVDPGRMPTLDAGGAARVAATGILLDARSGERYRGEVEPVDPVAGHIPGAVSAPVSGNVDSEGRFRPASALRERFTILGVRDDTPVGVYCGSGVTAAQQILALQLAGIPAALYVGSWSDWVADPSRPIRTGGGAVG